MDGGSTVSLERAIPRGSRSRSGGLLRLVLLVVVLGFALAATITAVLVELLIRITAVAH
jgi:hypothetical protein